MWIRVAAFLATRAATGWALAIGLTIAGGLFWQFHHRGDTINKLKSELVQCRGTSRQAEAIERLTRKVTEQAEEKSHDQIEAIKAIPNDCYYLDDPSPLNRVRDNENDNP